LPTWGKARPRHRLDIIKRIHFTVVTEQHL
jgi:hypothetical protein